MAFDYRLQRRLCQLAKDGYIVLEPGTNRCVLTNKGMAVILACADRPQKVEDLLKPSLAFERMQTDFYQARNSNPSLTTNQDKES